MSLSDVVENYQASFVPPTSLLPIRQTTWDWQDQFASRHFPSDPKERRMALKYNFIKKVAESMQTQVKVMYNPDENELGVVKHLQAQLTQASIDQWVWQMYDPPRDPGMGWVFANNFPEQRQRMIDLLNLKHDILEQLMVLKTKSFPDEDDAMLLFIINYMRPHDRQRFLTWLVGNDRSETVLKSIVGILPTLPREGHSMDINTINVNMAGATREVEVTDQSGNYRGEGVIPNRLWRKMSNNEQSSADGLRARPNGFANNADVLSLFAQLPLRGRVDYTLPTPYTANTQTYVAPDHRRVSLAPIAPGGFNIGNAYMSGSNVAQRIEHIMSGLNLN